MKKSLTALAVLGVFAGSAMAADVTLYGAIDTGAWNISITRQQILLATPSRKISSTCRMVGIRPVAGA
jgi:predicted porin